MDATRQGVTEGLPVYSADGARMGKVVRCGSTAFEIEKGFFFPRDYLLSYKDVVGVEDGKVKLALSKQALKDQWHRDDLIGERGGIAGQAAPIGYTTAAEVKRAGDEALQREAHARREAARASAPSDTYREVVPAQSRFQHEHHEEPERPISHRDFVEREAGVYAGGEPKDPLKVATPSEAMEDTDVDEVQLTGEDLSRPVLDKDEDYRI